jgi:Na+-driven multidrug efflux pump
MLPIIYYGGESIMMLFAKKEDVEVIRIGVKAIRINSFFYIFVGMIFITRNFLSGTGDIHIPTIMGITEVICRVLFANILIIYLSYYGIWWATALCWVLTSFVGVFRVVSGKWKNKSIIA